MARPPDDRTRTLVWRVPGGKPVPRPDDDRPAPDPRSRGSDDSVPALPKTIGAYQILDRLGEGGMGVVYEAEQQNPKRRVALKLVRGGRYVDPVHVRMFQREVDTLGRLKHPSIAAIYESGCTDEGQHFFAMELVLGSTLTEWRRNREREGSVPDEFRIRLALFRKICHAVAYAHQRGVIHRDIKPTNILVIAQRDDSTGSSTPGVPEIKVLDFGLARITESDVALSTVVSEVGKVQGTLPYMSPEQVRGDNNDIDLRTDVYSLGVVLYELLTGRLPYDLEKATLPEAARAICEETPIPLTRSWTGRRKPDRDIATIVLKALEKDPGRRYQSVSALAEDIDRYLTDQPILARPPSARYQLLKLVARHKVVFAASLTVALLTVAFAITMFFMFRVQRVERQRADAQRTEVERLNAELRSILESLKSAQAASPRPAELPAPPPSPSGLSKPAAVEPGPADLAGEISDTAAGRADRAAREDAAPPVDSGGEARAPSPQVGRPATRASVTRVTPQKTPAPAAALPMPTRPATALMLVDANNKKTAARIHILMGEFAEAERLLLESYQTILGAPFNKEKEETLELLVQVYDALGRPDEVRRFRGLLASLRGATNSGSTGAVPGLQ